MRPSLGAAAFALVELAGCIGPDHPAELRYIGDVEAAYSTLVVPTCQLEWDQLALACNDDNLQDPNSTAVADAMASVRVCLDRDAALLRSALCLDPMRADDLADKVRFRVIMPPSSALHGLCGVDNVTGQDPTFHVDLSVDPS